MATKKSTPTATSKETAKPAATIPAGLPPQKPYPPLTLISKATDKWPLADTDVRNHFGHIANCLREVVEFSKNLDELIQLDDQNPVTIGAGYFMNALMERISKAADDIDEVTSMLEPAEKGGGR